MGLQVFKRYARWYDLVYAKRDYKSEANFVYHWAGKPELIIDLGAGTGRHHKYWKSRVIGIDQSKDMLSQVKCGEKNLYIQGNIEELPKTLQGKDCYTALFNVIGYCNLDKVMNRLNQKKGGILIFDVWDTKKVQEEWFDFKIKQFDWGEVHISYEENKIKITVIPKKGRTIIEYHKVRSYSLKEIETLCKKYGYSLTRKDTNTWTTYYRLIKN